MQFSNCHNLLMKLSQKMRSISRYSTFFRLSLFILLFHVIAPAHLIFPDAFAASGMASQKERFSGMGATFKAKKKEAEEAEKKDEEERIAREEAEQSKNASDEAVTYFKLHTFVVNVVDTRDTDKLLFLTLEIYCKIQDSEDRWLINNHLAPIKDSIITYISGLNRQEIQTQKQKKSLQKTLTERASSTLKKLTGKKVISDLYLTRIIVQ